MGKNLETKIKERGEIPLKVDGYFFGISANTLNARVREWILEGRVTPPENFFQNIFETILKVRPLVTFDDFMKAIRISLDEQMRRFEADSIIRDSRQIYKARLRMLQVRHNKELLRLETFETDSAKRLKSELDSFIAASKGRIEKGQFESHSSEMARFRKEHSEYLKSMLELLTKIHSAKDKHYSAIEKIIQDMMRLDGHINDTGEATASAFMDVMMNIVNASILESVEDDNTVAEILRKITTRISREFPGSTAPEMDA